LSGIVGLLFVLAWASLVSPAADTLPAQLPDAEYWKMVADYSEPDGYFQYDIVTSNEISYQTVLPDLMRIARPGGTYLGVGPEQNFTYIAALQPKIAFLIDIRRAMMLEHLMYKAIFEMSADRIEFVANLFARKIPPQLTAESSVQTIFKRFANNPADRALADQRLKDILTRLKVRHSFPLTVEDERGIRALYTTFIREGVVNFSASFRSPGYAGLMTLTDYTGRNWSFLVSKENYDRVRAMHQKNLIVPLVGDFAGPKAIRVVGKYLRDHGATVNVFYISNVEDYIQHVWPQYVANIASLPLDSSSRFIRWSTNSQTTLASMDNFVRAQRPARR
jgi:hypothetical protein